MSRCYVTETDYRRWFTPARVIGSIGPQESARHERGDFCIWCGEWFSYEATAGPYCKAECGWEAERD